MGVEENEICNDNDSNGDNYKLLIKERQVRMRSLSRSCLPLQKFLYVLGMYYAVIQTPSHFQERNQSYSSTSQKGCKCFFGVQEYN